MSRTETPTIEAIEKFEAGKQEDLLRAAAEAVCHLWFTRLEDQNSAEMRAAMRALRVQVQDAKP